MKDPAGMIAQLNTLLADELTAIDQYNPHRGRAQAWGYGVFVTYIDERIDDEIKHSRALIRRIYELGGTPDTVARNEVYHAANMLEGLTHDRAAEQGAIEKYNTAIAFATATGDNATRDLLVDILKDEDDHLIDIEKRLVQIAQTQYPQWLSTQIG